MSDDVRIIHGDCLDVLPTLEADSFDAVVTDPPYPEVDREYGRWTEAEWWDLMMGVCREARRVLKPTGSAVFILQPNSRKVGSMRGWLWRFMAWACDEWNMVQDAWWWNIAAMPTVHSNRSNGLMRPALKACVWLGPGDCYRDQDAVLLPQSEAAAGDKRRCDKLRYSASGHKIRRTRINAAGRERGGVAPFNVLPLSNTNSATSAGAGGHGGGTPYDLADWWVRYISPPGGVVLDPFVGSGTVARAAWDRGRSVVGIERDGSYVEMARRDLAASRSRTLLFDGLPA